MKRVFILSALVIVVNTVMAQPRQSLIGLAITLLGTPAYLWWRSRLSAASPPAGGAE